MRNRIALNQTSGDSISSAIEASRIVMLIAVKNLPSEILPFAPGDTRGSQSWVVGLRQTTNKMKRDMRSRSLSFSFLSSSLGDLIEVIL
jgi:hypothetical protein